MWHVEETKQHLQIRMVNTETWHLWYLLESMNKKLRVPWVWPLHLVVVPLFGDFVFFFVAPMTVRWPRILRSWNRSIAFWKKVKQEEEELKELDAWCLMRQHTKWRPLYKWLICFQNLKNRNINLKFWMILHLFLRKWLFESELGTIKILK